MGLHHFSFVSAVIMSGIQLFVTSSVNLPFLSKMKRKWASTIACAELGFDSPKKFEIRADREPELPKTELVGLDVRLTLRAPWIRTGAAAGSRPSNGRHAVAGVRQAVGVVPAMYMMRLEATPIWPSSLCLLGCFDGMSSCLLCSKARRLEHETCDGVSGQDCLLAGCPDRDRVPQE